VFSDQFAGVTSPAPFTGFDVGSVLTFAFFAFGATTLGFAVLIPSRLQTEIHELSVDRRARGRAGGHPGTGGHPTLGTRAPPRRWPALSPGSGCGRSRGRAFKVSLSICSNPPEEVMSAQDITERLLAAARAIEIGSGTSPTSDFCGTACRRWRGCAVRKDSSGGRTSGQKKDESPAGRAPRPMRRTHSAAPARGGGRDALEQFL